jgi:ComF family protein
VCGQCLARFAAPQARCRRCACVVPEGMTRCGECLTAPPPFAHAVAAVDYGYPWDRLVAQLKFRNALDLGGVLAALLREAVERSDAPRAELVLPVPLSRERLRERGFNQAWELARRTARALRIDASASALLRVKDTPHQLSLPREQRAGNVRGAFAIDARQARLLQGRRVAVVDDVMTTGTTFAEVARVLQRAGAREVHAWAVARTPRPGDE